MYRWLAMSCAVLLALQTAACGTLIYPERRGQKSGQIDPGVAILDAAGLVVFLVPGLIAFGVDFATGCIYLPGGAPSASAGSDIRKVSMDPSQLDQAAIEATVEQVAGQPVDLADPAVEVVTVAHLGELERRLLGTP